MRVFAVDPGTTCSALVVMDEKKIYRHELQDNRVILARLADCSAADVMAIEMVASYGKPVGQETFETCVWIGRFMQVVTNHYRLFRQEIKTHLCGTFQNVKDGVIRQRLIDIYSNGAGKAVAIGLKKTPGPLYGISEDEWQALAVGVTFGEKRLGWKIQRERIGVQ